MNQLFSSQLFIQALGVVALLFSMLVFQAGKRKEMLELHTGASLLYSAHFFLLGGYSGAIINLVNALRNYSFYKLSKKSTNWTLPIFFIVLFVIAGLVSWQGPISLLPIIGAISGTIAFWQRDPRWIRVFSLFVAPTWFLYAMMIGSYPMMISEVIMFSSDVIGLFRYDYLKNYGGHIVSLHHKRKLHP